ncbi:MAG: hypothetical protein IJ361_08455 [Spirochaetaceae bacterium]|nr:hypothetical protein [Spirochaetaceae bacterium]
MKKLITLLLVLFIGTCLYAIVTPETIIEKINSLDLWCYDRNLAESGEKIYIELTEDTAADFTRKTRICFDWDLYPNQNEMNFEDVKSVFKSCNNLMFGYSYSTIADYSWKDGKNISYSVQYTIEKSGQPVDSAGTYVIRVFFNDNVLTILLRDESKFIEQKKEYKILNDLCIYKDGTLLDLNKGIERTKGYYWKNEGSIKTFYNMLKNKDSSLPKSSVNFQIAVEKIFEILDSYR